jgi:hypothetical protein
VLVLPLPQVLEQPLPQVLVLVLVLPLPQQTSMLLTLLKK